MPPPAGHPDNASPPKLSAPQQALLRLGLKRDIDLALHLPLRYEDETRLTPLADAREGDAVHLEGVVSDARIELRPRRQFIVHLAVQEAGEARARPLVLRFLHFYPSHQKSLAPGQRLRVRGELRGGFLGPELVHPAFRSVDAGAALPLTLSPVYPSTQGLPQAYLRRAVHSALGHAALHEVLPAESLPPGLPSLREALQFLHAPPAGTALEQIEDRSHPAWQRLKFDELLAQQLAQALARAERQRLHAPALSGEDAQQLVQRLRAALPFALTDAQQRVQAEIAADLARSQPMHRLLQGDVGSGKTVLAALAAAQAMGAGWQCVLMAPTEILAEQHFRKLVQWLTPLGVHTAWLSGSRKGRAREQALAEVASGQAQLVVGTHAVIQAEVAFARLGLAVVDEQHRFGVAQRLALRQKMAADRSPAATAGQAGVLAAEPHLLMMSATPIPRSLAMTVYADLDVSTLDELPPGRTPVVTRLFALERREAVVQRIREELGQGRQAYWVCPLIEESETLDLQNATATHAELSEALPGVMVGLLHGRMPAAEKAAVMSLFETGQMGLLVATTVIEVGVDVPNASLMVIEHAQRFGLAQLHQLRGRVGRGRAASACVLLYGQPLSAAGKERLRAMAQTNDGFEIAQRDLEIRGPGEFLGARQSGDALLRFADLAEDEGLLVHARAAAAKLLHEAPGRAQAQVARWLGGKADFLKA
jgi:ATP-dependent DNA helicase RecG